jgi:hypothetical protein
MKKLSILLVVVFCLGVCLVLQPEAQAQEYRPCCEGGFKPNKPCVTDQNCPDICIGGARDGKPCGDPETGCTAACVGGLNDGVECFSDGDCLNACIGGSKDGQSCYSDADCSSACVGGDKDGKQCTSDANCPGGTCSNFGACTDIGTCSNTGYCEVSTCTALCKKGKPMISPDDPVLEMPELPELEMVPHTDVCP